MNEASEMKTPMMQQYFDIKRDYQDCLLLYRMGDFYEMFMEDAEIGSKVLDITLTARNKGSDGKIPMCGVPFHSVDQYLSKLVKAGYKAAICEQITKPTPGRELVQRKVVRIITPGTVIDENMLEKHMNNYLLTFTIGKNNICIAYADISTGTLNVIKTPFILDNNVEILKTEVKKINPSEIVIDDAQYNNNGILNAVSDIESININHYKFEQIDEKKALSKIKSYFEIPSLNIFQIDESDLEILTVINRIIEYTSYTQKSERKNFTKINLVNTDKFLRIDSESIQNLELFRSNKTFNNAKEATFINLIDKTNTPMGARLLREWVLKPLVDVKDIHNRLDLVTHLIESHKIRSFLVEHLAHINDIERVTSKLTAGTGNARDLKNLAYGLQTFIEIISNVSNISVFKPYLYEINESLIEKISDLSKIINNTVVDEPPFTVREGGMIKDGVNEELDSIKLEVEGSKFWIENLEKTERQQTGIATLKVGYNSVFGYYIEITKTNTHLVPNHYHRKQTLVNAERYITQELKEKEDIVLSAREKTDEIEYKFFTQLIKSVYESATEIHIVARAIAHIDCLTGFAELALQQNYSKPVICDKSEFIIDIQEGRHPVVETVVNNGEFVPNSTNISEKGFFHLITGPNMAGKSTYIRQIALIQILAQMGSYVPAQTARMSVVDAIYTRIGAGDALAQGLSTFMVEMIETAKILHNATKYSLIILDEVGRGTSTSDGLSIAQSVVEYIYKRIEAKTLFATHFHELIDLEQRLKKIKNYHVGISENDDGIRFLHKVESGGTDKSYGIEVAKLAGVPDEVIQRAKEILNKNSSNQLKLSL